MDASLLSWLHALPTETFSCPFEQKALSLNIDPLQKPSLDGTWAEHVLSTPFKPQTLFPFNATPTNKPRSTELMTRSLAPQYDGLSYGLIRSQIFGDVNRNAANEASRSLAVCHLEQIQRTNSTILTTVEEIFAEEILPPADTDGLLKVTWLFDELTRDIEFFIGISKKSNGACQTIDSEFHSENSCNERCNEIGFLRSNHSFPSKQPFDVCVFRTSLIRRLSFH